MVDTIQGIGSVDWPSKRVSGPTLGSDFILFTYRILTSTHYWYEK